MGNVRHGRGVFRVAAAVMVLFVATAHPEGEGGANEAAPDSRLEEISIGEYWSGARVSLDDLAGKVVLFVIGGS